MSWRTKGRGETQALWLGCHACLQPVWQQLCSSAQCCLRGFAPPTQHPPAWGWGRSLPWQGEGSGGQAAHGRGWGNKMRLESWK